MALDLGGILVKSVFSALALLWGSLLFAVPVFIVSLLGAWLGKRIMKKYKISWLFACTLTSFLFVFVIVLALYFYPLVSVLNTQNVVGEVPEYLQMELTDTVAAIILIPLRLAIVSFVISILLLPMMFIASFVYEKISGKKENLNYYVKMFITAFCTVLLSWVLILFVFPMVLGFDIISGVLYMVYYGFAYF